MDELEQALDNLIISYGRIILPSGIIDIQIDSPLYLEEIDSLEKSKAVFVHNIIITPNNEAVIRTEKQTYHSRLEYLKLLTRRGKFGRSKILLYKKIY